jgi:hypothetical protein
MFWGERFEAAAFGGQAGGYVVARVRLAARLFALSQSATCDTPRQRRVLGSNRRPRSSSRATRAAEARILHVRCTARVGSARRRRSVEIPTIHPGGDRRIVILPAGRQADRGHHHHERSHFAEHRNYPNVATRIPDALLELSRPSRISGIRARITGNFNLVNRMAMAQRRAGRALTASPRRPAASAAPASSAVAHSGKSREIPTHAPPCEAALRAAQRQPFPAVSPRAGPMALDALGAKQERAELHLVAARFARVGVESERAFHQESSGDVPDEAKRQRPHRPAMGRRQ